MRNLIEVVIPSMPGLLILAWTIFFRRKISPRLKIEFEGGMSKRNYIIWFFVLMFGPDVVIFYNYTNLVEICFKALSK